MSGPAALRHTVAGLAILVLASAVSVPVQAAELPVGGTSFGSTIFIDATHLDQTKRGKPVPLNRDGVDLKRFYLSVDHRFSDVWSAHLLTDINWTRNQSPTDLWFKHAYVQGAFSKAFVLRLGAADMPWAGFANQWGGYRYVDKELVTRLSYGTSADWGVHTLGALADGGQVQYAASVVTGSSFKHPRTGDRPDVEARIGWQPTRDTVIAIGGYDGTRSLDGGFHQALHTARRFDALAAYADKRWRAGVQYFSATDWNQVRSTAGDRADGWSAWASVQFAPGWAAFVRADEAHTSRDLDPSLRDRYRNLGVAWSVSRTVQVAAAYKYERQSDDTHELMRSREVGLWAQVKL
jgi:hypothetical protein